MKKNISRVKLYVKNTLVAHEIEKEVRDELLKNNFEINDNNFDLLISIGGDGSFLKMVHMNNFDDNCYYAAINAGSLGFLTSIDKENIKTFIKDIRNNQFKIRKSNILKVKAYTSQNDDEFYCINELTIRKIDFTTLKCEILINNSLLDKYVGDGLVISTPIGSTGYNMPLGGAIIDNDIMGYSITPLVPINNSVYKSLVNSVIISAEKKVTISFNDNSNLAIVSDGKLINLLEIERIECSLSNKSIECIMPIGYNYIDNIKSKIIDSGEH